MESFIYQNCLDMVINNKPIKDTDLEDTRQVFIIFRNQFSLLKSFSSCFRILMFLPVGKNDFCESFNAFFCK